MKNLTVTQAIASLFADMAPLFYMLLGLIILAALGFAALFLIIKIGKWMYKKA